MDNEPSETASLASQICAQITSVFATATPHHAPPLSIIVSEISTTTKRNGKIFLHGVGREFLMLKALAMRLFHLGLSAHCVGDVTTPPISSRDLLIASAGPGGFSTVDAICGVARSNGARVLVITAKPEGGSCVTQADVVAYLPARTMGDENMGSESGALLPMGSLYEGALFVLFEMVVFKLVEVLGVSLEAFRSRHTNLE